MPTHDVIRWLSPGYVRMWEDGGERQRKSNGNAESNSSYCMTFFGALDIHTLFCLH